MSYCYVVIIILFRCEMQDIRRYKTFPYPLPPPLPQSFFNECKYTSTNCEYY